MIALHESSARTKLVRDVMQDAVISVTPEMTVREVIRVLIENAIHGAPVVDQQGRAIGVVSMTDVLELAGHEAEIPAGQIDWEPVVMPEEISGDDDIERTGSLVPFTEPMTGGIREAAFDQYQARDIMTPVPFALSADDTLETAVAFMLRGRIHRALVVDNGFLEGIITPFDVLKSLGW